MTVIWVIIYLYLFLPSARILQQKTAKRATIECTHSISTQIRLGVSFVAMILGKCQWWYYRSGGSFRWVRACKRETGRLVLGSWRRRDYPREASAGHVSCTQTKNPHPQQTRMKCHVLKILTEPDCSTRYVRFPSTAWHGCSVCATCVSSKGQVS